jgi:stage II sporulation protein D
VVLTAQDQLATVYYHSTCGGKTEAAENVFSGTRIPYLSVRTDAIGDRFACAASPYFRWTETRTIDQLDSAFEVRFNRSMLDREVSDTTTVRLAAQVTERTTGGRVQTLAITYGDTTITLNGYEVRRFLARAPETYLKSTLFYIEPYNDSTLVLQGAGFGHGVGMCQFGALEMSRSGFQYYHILHKYFPSTVLTRKY